MEIDIRYKFCDFFHSKFLVKKDLKKAMSYYFTETEIEIPKFTILKIGKKIGERGFDFKFMNDIYGGDLKLKETRGCKIDVYKCNIENLLEMKRNIIIKTISSVILDEDVIEVLFIDYLFIYSFKNQI
jgi:hypothetical protein